MTKELVAAFTTLARGMRSVIGVPDYERYVDHVRSAHPDQQPLTCEEFMKERLEHRYSRPGAKCC